MRMEGHARIIAFAWAQGVAAQTASWHNNAKGLHEAACGHSTAFPGVHIDVASLRNKLHDVHFLVFSCGAPSKGQLAARKPCHT